ncbi:MAG: class II fumarate hydratase [Verrucomicrobiota bacterium]|nr:class II fumarate hydratase [Verrucomicrobiota bacterium]
MTEFRKERDAMGEIAVPTDKYWGAQTERALHHFAVGSDRMPTEFIHAYAILKKAAALANGELGVIPTAFVPWIVTACDEIIEGKWDAHFPLCIWQTGSGTQTHMNVNEVIANLANVLAGGTLGSKSPVHPNDHVNASQSSNDTFPTAMHIAAALNIHKKLLPQIEKLRTALQEKEKSFAGIVKIGRTHLQDATPLLLSQEFSGYVALVDRSLQTLRIAAADLFDLAIGGTAVGTGLNAPTHFAERVVQKIKETTGLPFRSHPNFFAALSAHDEIVFVSSALRRLAASLFKIATDLSWLGSGPRAGLGELRLPENEPGSSIMPGKVNPTQCELMRMVALQVMGNDATIGMAGSQGNFELHVLKPLLLHNLFHSLHLLHDAALSFQRFCIEGIEANQEKIASFVQSSLMLVTALTPHLGYDRCAQIARFAYKENISLREATLHFGFLTGEEFDRLIDPTAMV